MKSSEMKEIDGSTYEFFPLPPKVALRVLTRLSKLVLEPLGIFGDAIKGVAGGDKTDGAKAMKLLDTKLPPDIFSKAAKILVNSLDEDEVLSTIDMVLSPSAVHVCNPEKGDKGTRKFNMDVDMAGRPGHLIKVFVAALEAQFGDFFGASGGGLAALAARAKTAMK